MLMTLKFVSPPSTFSPWLTLQVFPWKVCFKHIHINISKTEPVIVFPTDVFCPKLSLLVMAHCLFICSRQKTESSLVLFLSFPLRFKNIKSCWLNFQNTHYIYLSFLHRPVCIAASFASFTEVLLLILPAPGLTFCLSRQYSTAKGHCSSTVKESLHKTPACQPSLSPISHLLVHLPRILAVSQTWWTGPFGRPLHQRLIYPVGQ